VAGQLENLVQKQAEQFQKVMESFGESFKKGSTEPKGKNK